MRAHRWLDLFCVALIGLGTATLGVAQERSDNDTKKTPRTGRRMQDSKSKRPRTIPPRPGTSSRYPAKTPRAQDKSPLVDLEIICGEESWGHIVVELSEERTPNTARNFLRYVDDGFYDGTIFHRVLPGFLIQGGGYVSVTEKKTKHLRSPVRNESRRGLRNERGTIAMARKSQPNTAVCQFFINLSDNEELDYPKAGAYGYCAFGRVIEGMDVVERIAATPTRVSDAAQRRFERYQQEGREVEEAEQSEPLNAPMIKGARRIERADYESGAWLSSPAKRPSTRRGLPEELQPPMDPRRRTGRGAGRRPGSRPGG